MQPHSSLFLFCVAGSSNAAITGLRADDNAVCTDDGKHPR